MILRSKLSKYSSYTLTNSNTQMQTITSFIDVSPAPASNIIKRCLIVVTENIEEQKNNIVDKFEDKISINNNTLFKGTLKQLHNLVNSDKKVLLFDNLTFYGKNDLKIGIFKEILGTDSFFYRSQVYKGKDLDEYDDNEIIDESQIEFHLNEFRTTELKIIIILKNLDNLERGFLNRCEIVNL